MAQSDLKTRLRTLMRGGVTVDLHYILERATHHLSPSDRLEWLDQLVFWIRGEVGATPGPAVRVRFLLQRLEQNPQWKEAGARQLQEILRGASILQLLTETGVPRSNDFLREAIRRALRSVLPPEEDPTSLSSILTRVFWHPEDAEWLTELPVDLREGLLNWARLAAEGGVISWRIDDSAAACAVLAVRAAEIAVRDDVATRAPEYAPQQNPFLGLRWSVEEVLDSLRGGALNQANVLRSEQEFRLQVVQCRKYLLDVESHLERFGVSVDLVFQLERAHAYLRRLEEITALLCKRMKLQGLPESAPKYDTLAWDFFVKMVRGIREDRRLGRLVRENLHLISLKTVERTGEVGEDYITRDAGGYRHMFLMAAGGGFLTAGTALLKYLGPHDLPPFFAGAYAALNYSLSFLLMHFVHFKLATKQPSMTASALARRLEEGKREGNFAEEGFIEEVARISRSQFAAVAGNILAVIPTAWLLDRAMILYQGHHLLSEAKANAVLASINPVTSLTIFYAALTGVLLWFSGFVAAWVENAFVFYRVPWALKGHRFLKNLLGVTRLEAWVSWIGRHLIGVVSAVTLGVALAFVPLFGEFFGLPIDVRHITLTTGGVTFALSTLTPWDTAGWPFYASIAGGILFIGLMNFGISFALALNIAIRAREIEKQDFQGLLGKVLLAFVRRPIRFLFPGRALSPLRPLA